MNPIKSCCILSNGLIVGISLLVVVFAFGRAYGQTGGVEPGTAVHETAAEVETAMTGNERALIALAAAATVGIACISAGYAVAKVGSAALGAASEKPEILGRALLFVGLAEGVAIYGLIIAIILVTKI